MFRLFYFNSYQLVGRLLNVCVSLHTVDDVDTLLQLCFKVLDTADWRARQCIAELAASILLISQVKRLSVPSRHIRPTKGPEELMDAQEDTVKTRMPQSALISVEAIMQRVLVAYHRQGVAGWGRNGLIQVLANFFRRAGRNYISEHLHSLWSTVSEGFSVEDVPTGFEADLVMARAYVNVLFGDIIIGHVLHEAEQQDFLRFLITQHLDLYPNVLPGRTSPTVPSMLYSLDQVTNLLTCFGQSPKLEDRLLETILQRLCASPEVSLQSAAYKCLSAYVSAVPQRLLHLLEKALDELEDWTTRDGSARANLSNALPDLFRLGRMLSVLLASGSAFAVHNVEGTCARAISLSTRLLRLAGDQEIASSKGMTQTAWLILSGVLENDAFSVAIHVPQLLLLWKNAFPKNIQRDTRSIESRPLHELDFLLTIREAALGAISTFLRSRIAENYELDLVRRIEVILSHALTFYISLPNQPLPGRTIIDNTREQERFNAIKARYLSRLLQAFLFSLKNKASSIDVLHATLFDLCLSLLLRQTRAGDSTVSAHGTGPEAIREAAAQHWGLVAVNNPQEPGFDALSPAFDMQVSYAQLDFIIEQIPRDMCLSTKASFRGKVGPAILFDSQPNTLIDLAVGLFIELYPRLSLADQTRSVDRIAALWQYQEQAGRLYRHVFAQQDNLVMTISGVAQRQSHQGHQRQPSEETLFLKMITILKVRYVGIGTISELTF